MVEWIKKMWYTHSGILSSLKERGNSVICYMMDEPWHNAKSHDPITEGQTLYDSTYIRYLKQSNS